MNRIPYSYSLPRSAYSTSRCRVRGSGLIRRLPELNLTLRVNTETPTNQAPALVVVVKVDTDLHAHITPHSRRQQPALLWPFPSLLCDYLTTESYFFVLVKHIGGARSHFGGGGGGG